MATHNVVHVEDLGLEFDIGNIQAGKIRLKVDASLTVAADGTVSVNMGNISIVSPDAANIIDTDANGLAFLDQAGVRSVETPWTGITDTPDYLTITQGGGNGHEPTFSIDPTNAAWREVVQDHLGALVQNTADLTYDDALNALTVALQNVAAGNGVNLTAGVLSAVADPNSPDPVTVSAAGISVTTGISPTAGNLAELDANDKVLVDPAKVTALATDQVCNAFGVAKFKVFPN